MNQTAADNKKADMDTTPSPLSLAFPETVLVDTVSFCNLRCSMCPHVNMTRKKGRMAWPLFTRIIDEIAILSPHSRVWLVFFGEPLMLKKTTPSIFDMIQYCKQKGLTNVVLNSNGNLLDKESSRKLLDAGLDELYVGIDAFTEGTYEKLRVGGDYRNTVRNVLDFLDVLRERGLHNFPIQVQFVEMDCNRQERDSFIDFWTSKGVTVKIRKKLTWAGLVKSDQSQREEDRHKCYWAMNTLSITDQGFVVTCAADPDARFIAGDVNKQSIKETWAGKLAEFRMLHEEGRWGELPYPCRDCEDWRVSYEDRLIPGRRDLRTKLIRFSHTWWCRLKGGRIGHGV